MIVTITANPALDTTLTVPTLTPGTVHRCVPGQQAPGGKGINVSRILAQLRQPSILTGFIGGRTGEEVLALVASDRYADRLQDRFVRAGVDTRRCYSITDERGGTVINEEGLPVSADAFDRLTGLVSTLTARLFIIAGSFPPGTTRGQVTDLVRACRGTVLVDVTGEALCWATEAGADILTPNESELLSAFPGLPLDEAAAQLGAPLLLVSRGEAGVRVYRDGVLAFDVPVARRVTGNPTGAGDAFVAAFAAHLTDSPRVPDNEELAEWVRDAQAVAGASVAATEVGTFDEETYRSLLS